MAVDGGHRDGGCDWDGRWNHVRKFLERPGPFTHPDFEPSTEFHIIVCGLDSIIARRWMNGMLISLLSYEDGVLDPSSIIPLIDGGTEGFKGNARVILPGMNACIDCTLELYPPQENCSACSQVPQDLQFPPSAKLQEILEYLTENASLQMKSPAITTTLEGKNKTLYLQSVKSIEERTRPNLCKTLKELGLSDGQELAVADVTTPQTVLFKLNFTA
ncbi:NEDD8-activating enzyme E1 catalytic subunit [Nibea albiflora]|uniref:NEDD8-activating enzyme E1 catalytic subunit n=1 Tax=Nibea albiflora TaxID=240163 RepID=A0ACB7EJY3_NIBAL|nr:NEDD8-activating enzyme E1 catalytic subunit [Nibea albiflora]